MFFALLVLALIGVGVLFGAGVAVAAGIAFKVFFFLLLFGMFSKAARRHGGHRRWDPSHGRDERPSSEERFEDWHRLAHAKEEVDSWVPEIDSSEQE